jgi:protein associated with RNAse G/E
MPGGDCSSRADVATHPGIRGQLRDSMEVEYLTKKWDGKRHKFGQVDHLGDDQFGTWLWGRAGRTIVVGANAFVTEQDAVYLAAPGAWWMPGWWSGHPEISLYVDICTPVVCDLDHVEYVDLDLDVVRYTDGRAETVDRDEFEANQIAFNYPAEVIAGAEDAARIVLNLIERKDPPFDGVVAQDWFKRARTIAPG